MWLVAAVALVAVVAGPALAHSDPAIEHGDTVDVTDVEAPDRAVGGRPFTIDVTLRNRDSASRDAFLHTVLYDDARGTECAERGRGPQAPYDNATDAPARFVKNVVALRPGETRTIDGEAEHWGQVVNASRLARDGVHTLCAWVQNTDFTDDEGRVHDTIWWDHDALRLDVRRANAAPAAEPRIAPAEARVGESVRFAAGAGDLDGDPVEARWDFGDGKVGEGDPTHHSYARPGEYAVTVTLDDGWEAVTLDAGTVRVTAAPEGPRDVTPGPSLTSLALALALALARRGRSRRG